MIVSLEFVLTKHQLAHILTKARNSLRFEFLRKSLGICLINWSSQVIGLKGFELFVYFLFVSFGLVLIVAWAYHFCLFTWYIIMIRNTSSLWTREIYYIYKTWCRLNHKYLLITIDIFLFLIIKYLCIVELQL